VYRKFFKRLIDLVCSLAGFVILLPLFLILTILLWAEHRTSPFFIQQRPGRNLRPIRIIKFRTMNDKRDRDGNLLPDDDRLTFIGKLVRKTSLDEIPQLINIIRGDMSLIGPRPLLSEYIPLYSPEQIRRHEVRPGITGWAQINGRNAIRWSEKFSYDVWYVDHISFWLDLKILFITVVKVLKAEGISGEGVLTTKKFDGGN
jgi:lipopolysaccharide/colanic/teichoic acid biosynthesis glycosyltransferase